MIFLLLYFAFKSLRLALIIFLNVPFAVTGGVFALALRSVYVSRPSVLSPFLEWRF